jgi:hypothetical protein
LPSLKPSSRRRRTVYARFRNKRTLLGELMVAAVRGRDPRPVPEQEGPRAIAAATDQREQVRLFAADVVAGAARADDELRALSTSASTPTAAAI